MEKSNDLFYHPKYVFFAYDYRNVYFDTIKQAVNTEANVTMTSTSTAYLYNVHVRGSLKDCNGNALEIYNSSGTKIWG